MINKFLKVATKVFWLIGLLLLLFLITDIISAYNTLSKINLWLGIAFLGIVLFAMSWITYMLLSVLLDRKEFHKPPKIKNWGMVNNKKLRAYNEYLLNRHEHLLGKDNMPEDYLESAKEKQNEIAVLNKRSKTYVDLIKLNQQIKTELYPIVNSYYHNEAETIIEDCVRDIMVYVIISPYKAVDIFIVLSRNLKMYRKLIALYKIKVPFFYKTKMLMDILKIMIVVNYLNVGEKVIEELFNKIPLLNKYAGDVTQGIGAGILSNSFGQLTLKRINCLDVWNETIEKDSFRKQIGSFSKTVIKIFKKIKIKDLFSKKDQHSNEHNILK